MASTDSSTFPSSPPRQLSTTDMSSSPLPSISDLIQKKPALIRSGSRATPIPEYATSSFTSPSSLFNASTTTPQHVEAIRGFMLETNEDAKDRSKTKDVGAKKPRKVAVKKTAVVKDKVTKAPRESAIGSVEIDKDDRAQEDVKPKTIAKPRVKKIVLDENGQPVQPKPKAKKVVLGEDGELVEKPAAVRKPRFKKGDKDVGAGVMPVKDKPARKPRAKKVEDGSQPKLVQGRVTKTSSKSKAGASAENTVNDFPDMDPFTDPVAFGLGLADAVRRRVSWTPPPFAAAASLATPSNADLFGKSPTSEATNLMANGKQGFGNLLGNFGFMTTEEPVAKKSPAKKSPTKNSPSQIVRKRKLIELVKTNTSVAGVTPPVKEKAPKKKPRTITEQATSAYRENEETELPVTSAPLLQYFTLDKTTSEDGFKIPLKPRTRNPVKAQKAKKGTIQAPILLSPESALKQARNQDYVFGTSSQLAREESPTLLRDLHAAMQASNDAEVTDNILEELLSPDKRMSSSRISVVAERNLWSAAARDSGGELMEVDILDLAYSSPVIQRACQSKVPAVPLSENVHEEWHDIESMDVTVPPGESASMSAHQEQSEVVAEDWHDIDAMDISGLRNQRFRMIAAQTQNKVLISVPSAECIQEDWQDWPDIEAMEESLPSKKSGSSVPATKRGPIETAIQEMLSSPGGAVLAYNSPAKLIVARDGDVAKTASPKSGAGVKATRKKKMPDFSAYPTAKLEKEIKAYGFKPVKGRNPMIALMQQCWESKHGTVLKNLDANAAMIIPASSKPPPSGQAVAKSPGRPKKSAALPSPVKEKRKVSRKKADNTVEGLEMDSDTPLSQIRALNTTGNNRKGSTEEIEDSDGLLTPSPPRRQGSQAGMMPAPLQILGDDVDLSPDALEKLLFTHITRAVKEAPPATSSTNPSWHEKILMYDPIVLEDLTVWLNVGGLEKVGWDGEVEPKEVKKWCESKSICCLWKESLRNGTRSRY